MSHEIRTPMNGIIGMTELLLRDSQTEQQHHRTLSIKNCAKSLRRIINDILDFSKIEAGKLDLEKIPFKLDELLDSIYQLQTIEADKKSITLLCPTQNIENLWLKGDPTRLHQILTNLINNAIKFTAQGSVSVNVSLKDDSNGNHTLDCTVKDSGIGMNDGQQKQLFQKFSQADTSTTRKYGGTGLGLSISKQLVELMGGKISIKSSLGIGTTIQFFINVEKSTEPTKPFYPNSMNRFTADILLVEDNIINQEVAKSFLVDLGLNVFLASNGQEAIESLKTKSFDLIFMDCQMPIIDGYDTTRILRDDDTLRSIPIIAMTANAMKGDKDACLKAGMNDYLAKPISVDDLQKILTRWLPNRCTKLILGSTDNEGSN